jgi:hypothetical protein
LQRGVDVTLRGQLGAQLEGPGGAAVGDHVQAVEGW